MDIETCKNCEFHRLDTLADGTKEDYCYPKSCFYLTAPCKKRKKSQCKEIRGGEKKLPWMEVK